MNEKEKRIAEIKERKNKVNEQPTSFMEDYIKRLAELIVPEEDKATKLL